MNRNDYDDYDCYDYEQNYQHNSYKPEGKTRLVFTFSFSLLTGLKQPIYFGVLWEEPFDFLKFWNRIGVVLGPVKLQPFSIEFVGGTVFICSSSATNVFHYRVRGNHERETRDFLSIDGVATER